MASETLVQAIKRLFGADDISFDGDNQLTFWLGEKGHRYSIDCNIRSLNTGITLYPFVLRLTAR